MPNNPVDVNSWGLSACYPRRTFYPLSNGPSIWDRWITKPYFRTCSTCKSHSQAPFCLYTRRTISIRAEGTLGRLRYSLGGDRPSQTARQTLSFARLHGFEVRIQLKSGWYSKVDSTDASAPASKSPTYPIQTTTKPNINLQ